MDLDTIILKLTGYLRIMHDGCRVVTHFDPFFMYIVLSKLDIAIDPAPKSGPPYSLFLPPGLCWEGLQDFVVLPPPLNSHCPGMWGSQCNPPILVVLPTSV